MITPEQRELRKKYLGASEVAAVMGLDPYRSAADCWLEKTGIADPFEGNEATERGNLLEPAILRYAGNEIGKTLTSGVMKIHPGNLLAANFDAIPIEPMNAPDFVVEAKSSRVAGEYGEPGTDEVPDKVVIQTHAQMEVAGPQCRLAYVPIITAGLDFRMYIVQRNQAICDEILRVGTEFMERYVKPRVRPSDFRPSMEVLKRVRRQPNTIIDVPKSLIDDWVIMDAARKEAEEDADAAKAALLAAMKEADCCQDETGRTLTYWEQERKEYVVKATKFRVLRIRKNVKKL